MTRNDVRQKMERFFRYLAEEQELRDELCSLKFANVTEKEAREALSRQNQLLRRIDELHKSKMLPLVNEVADFVAQKTRELKKAEQPKDAGKKPAATKPAAR